MSLNTHHRNGGEDLGASVLRRQLRSNRPGASDLDEQEEPILPDPSVTGGADDEEDDLVLGTAVAAGADFLVTGDTGLLRIGEYRGVRIVTARQFLLLIGED